MPLASRGEEKKKKKRREGGRGTPDHVPAARSRFSAALLHFSRAEKEKKGKEKKEEREKGAPVGRLVSLRPHLHPPPSP